MKQLNHFQRKEKAGPWWIIFPLLALAAAWIFTGSENGWW